MAPTGLLILTAPLSVLTSRLRNVLTLASQHVSRTLYVHLEPTSLLSPRSIYKIPKVESYAKFITKLYASSHNVCNGLDIRVFLDNLKENGEIACEKKHSFDVVLTDCKCQTKDMKDFLSFRFNQLNNTNIQILNLYSDDIISSNTLASHSQMDEDASGLDMKTYKNCVLGGTFDRLHSGHKILLTEAVLSCTRQLTVGVTDESMIKKKILPELIQSTSLRMQLVQDFLEDVDQRLKYKIVPINDPFGPSTEDADLECIIVSDETLRGGQKVNEERQKKGFKPLAVRVVHLAEDDAHSKEEELKISSSSSRMRLLGMKLRYPQYKPELPKTPYVIGLTGGIASGKSSIAKYLESLGAIIINTDRLAHTLYRKGTDLYDNIILEFGKDIIGPDGEINRRVLGPLVFSDKSKLEKLNALVWPEVSAHLRSYISKCGVENKSVVVLEVPVLIQSGMIDLVHEVWVSIIPREEALQRIQERDKLDIEQAQQRVDAQLNNETLVSHANVVFSTLWEPAYTQKQVSKAWAGIEEHLHVTALNKL